MSECRRTVRVRGAEMPVRLGSVAARHRDVELGIAPHAVLADVEAGGLDLRLGADADRLVEDPEHRERRAERERADGGEAERLDAELVEAAAVQETALPCIEPRREARDREEAERQRSPDAGHPVRRDLTDGVVDAE